MLWLEDPAETAAAFATAACDRLPVRLEGKVNWLLSRKGDGWQLAAFNPHGVTVDFVKGEQADPKAAVEISVSGTGVGRARAVSSWPAETRLGARRTGVLEATIGPGGGLILEW